MFQVSDVLTPAQSQAQWQATIKIFGRVSPYLRLTLIHIAMQTQAQAQPQAQAQTQAQAQAQASQDTANAAKNLIAGVSSLASLVRTALAPTGAATPATAVPTVQQQVSVLQCLKIMFVRKRRERWADQMPGPPREGQLMCTDEFNVLCSWFEVPLNWGSCRAVSQKVVPVKWF